MRKKRFCVGLVGSQFAAEFHERSYRKVTGYDLTVKGVTSKHRSNAEKFAEAHGIPEVYENYEEMLSDDAINIIDLCIPPKLHKPFTIRALEAGKHVICEKPLTGYFGQDLDSPGSSIGQEVSRRKMLEVVLQEMDDMERAIDESGRKFMYAENWVYAPSIQKARRLLEASGGTLLEIYGKEAHSGSHAKYYGIWKESGGGSFMGKGCHPLSAALYLKRCEGLSKKDRPIRPRYISAQVNRLSEVPEEYYGEQQNYIRTEYRDVEDWVQAVVTFEDGTVATINASEIVVGGLQAEMQLYMSNGRINCTLSGVNTGCTCYAPDEQVFADEYLVEKQETKAGWSFPAPDEDWMVGYPHELQDFVACILDDREPLSGFALARDTIVTIYAGYLSAAKNRRIEIPL